MGDITWKTVCLSKQLDNCSTWTQITTLALHFKWSFWAANKRSIAISLSSMSNIWMNLKRFLMTPLLIYWTGSLISLWKVSINSSLANSEPIILAISWKLKAMGLRTSLGHQNLYLRRVVPQLHIKIPKIGPWITTKGLKYRWKVVCTTSKHLTINKI